MKTFFWLVVVVLLIITFSDHELIRPYRDKAYELILDKAPSSGRMNDQQALRRIQQQLTELGNTLGEGQQRQLSRAIESKESILQFRQRYCIDRDFNPLLFGDALRESCEIIELHHEALTRR